MGIQLAYSAHPDGCVLITDGKQRPEFVHCSRSHFAIQLRKSSTLTSVMACTNGATASASSKRVSSSIWKERTLSREGKSPTYSIDHDAPRPVVFCRPLCELMLMLISPSQPDHIGYLRSQLFAIHGLLSWGSYQVCDVQSCEVRSYLHYLQLYPS
jgi:hypothetical protein